MIEFGNAGKSLPKDNIALCQISRLEVPDAVEKMLKAETMDRPHLPSFRLFSAVTCSLSSFLLTLDHW